MKKKLFKEHILFNELHSSLNKQIDFSDIYETSSQKVFWQCQKDSRHVWEQKIRSRTMQKYGCSYCSGRKTLREDSLGVLHPKIASEVNKYKNPNFDVFAHSPKSNKMVFWKCSVGHEWKTKVFMRTRNKDPECPTCRKKKASFASKYPSLLEEWHPSKNNKLDPWELLPNSKQEVWWTCTNSEVHEDWESTIKSRTNNNKRCPKCIIEEKKQNRRKGRLPFLNVYSKELSAQWHPVKNGSHLPSQYTAGSIFKAWWLCPTCEKEWKSTIVNRARLNKGCPSCATSQKKKEGKKIGSSIIQTHPQIIPHWHKTLNKDLTPEQFTYGSGQKIWWQCLKNNEHVWLEKISLRTKGSSSDCKICKQEENSLQTNYPEVAAEWHPNKNGSLTPNHVSQASGKMIWWQCFVNPEHEWQAVIRNRTLNKSSCNQCSSEKQAIHLKNPGQVIDPKDVNNFHVFLSSLESLSLLLEHPIESNRRLIQPMYRMIYSSAITSLESFLSDAFLIKVVNNSERILSVIKSNKELNTKKYSIEEVVDWHKNVELKVIEYLSNIIWHNIYNVKTLYKNTLSISFPNNTPKIIRAVGIRHDLVHRNGKTKSGKMHILSKNEVKDLLNEIKNFVSNLQDQLVKI